MPLSDAALREIAKVLRKHVAPRTLDEIAAELVEIRGDKDFRDTIERLVYPLRIELRVPPLLDAATANTKNLTSKFASGARTV